MNVICISDLPLCVPFLSSSIPQDDMVWIEELAAHPFVEVGHE